MSQKSKSATIVPIASLIGVILVIFVPRLLKLGYFQRADSSYKTFHISNSSAIPKQYKKPAEQISTEILTTYNTALDWANTNFCSAILTKPSLQADNQIFATPNLASLATQPIPYIGSASSPSAAANGSFLAIPSSKGLTIPTYCVIGFYSNQKLGGRSLESSVYKLAIYHLSSREKALSSDGGITIPVAIEIGLKDEVFDPSGPSASSFSSSYRRVFIVVDLSGHLSSDGKSVVLDSFDPKVLDYQMVSSTSSYNTPAFVAPNGSYKLPKS
jgi:hypothetical protein